MLGPDFPFAYDEYLAHPAGLGHIPSRQYGKPVAIIGGGLSGIVTAFELMRLGLRPVVFEAGQLGGRLRTHYFPGFPRDVNAMLGAMRFPAAATSLSHYIKEVGLKTTPLPIPLSETSPSTVIGLEGKTYYGRKVDDFPQIFQDVALAWERTLEEQASFSKMRTAIRERDTPTIKRIWNQVVREREGQSFYGFLQQSPAFHSFRFREVLGQVGFGTGGWDSDFPSSILEILRLVCTGADEDHYSIIGGSAQLPEGLWHHGAAHVAHWPAGTSLATLHPGKKPLQKVTQLRRDEQGVIVVTDAAGCKHSFAAAVFTAQTRALLSNIDCDSTLLPNDVWRAIERMHFMGSSKVFIPVDRPFWLDLDPNTGRHVMSMTLTDRLLRGVYPLGSDPNRPAVICLSYTWADDSAKWATLSARERADLAMRSLQTIRRHVTGPAVAISWENEPGFLGAFKINRPSHYRYQRILFMHTPTGRVASAASRVFGPVITYPGTPDGPKGPYTPR